MEPTQMGVQNTESGKGQPDEKLLLSINTSRAKAESTVCLMGAVEPPPPTCAGKLRLDLVAIYLLEAGKNLPRPQIQSLTINIFLKEMSLKSASERWKSAESGAWVVVEWGTRRQKSVKAFFKAFPRCWSFGPRTF
jgi:hypothetical protein